LSRSTERGFFADGLSRDTYSNANAIADIIKSAFVVSGLPPYTPHSFRKTLVRLGSDICKTPEQFKAWSLNLGHSNIITTMSAYCQISPERQAELITHMNSSNAG
jgi:integrase